jgi:nucleoside-diphosphate-sugar epimerase
MDNYVARFAFGMPFVALLDGYDTPLQFVHEADVVAAICEILGHDGRGAYNVSPPDWLPVSELARATGRACWRLPFWLAYAVHWLAWATRLPIHESPAPFLYFVRYPWVITPARLERELGFQFRFTSRQTVQQIVERFQQQRSPGTSGGASGVRRVV